MPPVSEAERRAMYAAKAGHSTLGIPQSVGEEFIAADRGGKLPAKVKEGKPVRKKGHHHTFRPSGGYMDNELHTHHEHEQRLREGGLGGQHIGVHHRGGETHGVEYEMHPAPESHGSTGHKLEGEDNPHKPSGKTYANRDGHLKGRPHIGEKQHMALSNTGPNATAHPYGADANFSQREHHEGTFPTHHNMGDAASYHEEHGEFGTDNLADNLGSKRVSGYGDPMGGTTELAGTPHGIEHLHGMHGEGPHGLPGPEHGLAGSAGAVSGMHTMEDGTRGTHNMAPHQFAASHEVPQEVKHRLAMALTRRR